MLPRTCSSISSSVQKRHSHPLSKESQLHVQPSPPIEAQSFSPQPDTLCLPQTRHSHPHSSHPALPFQIPREQTLKSMGSAQILKSSKW